jgi:hypothetical protein
MLGKLLNKFFLGIIAREILILLGILIFITAIPLTWEQGYLIRKHWDVLPVGHDLEEMEDLVDALGGVFVAVGVFWESRETLRNMALLQKEEHDSLQLFMNDIAHHNGMGILLVGLFMEIGTAIMKIPERLINTDGSEKYVFSVCLLLSIAGLYIVFDFVKDFIVSYFVKPSKVAAH